MRSCREISAERPGPPVLADPIFNRRYTPKLDLGAGVGQGGRGSVFGRLLYVINDEKLIGSLGPL